MRKRITIFFIVALTTILAGQAIQSFSPGGNLSPYNWKRYNNRYYTILYPRAPTKKTINKNNHRELNILTYSDLVKGAYFSSSFTKTSANINELTSMPIDNPKRWLNQIHDRKWIVTVNKILSYKHYDKNGFSVRDVTYDLTYQNRNDKIDKDYFVSHAIYYVKPHLVIRTNASSLPDTVSKNQKALNKFLESLSITTNVKTLNNAR